MWHYFVSYGYIDNHLYLLYFDTFDSINIDISRITVDYVVNLDMYSDVDDCFDVTKSAKMDFVIMTMVIIRLFD